VKEWPAIDTNYSDGGSLMPGEVVQSCVRLSDGWCTIWIGRW